MGESKNLVISRGQTNVWDKVSAAERSARLRRFAVIVAAGALVVYGRRGHGLARMLAAAGAMLASRAIAGYDDMARVSTMLSAGERSRDEVHEASEESFPASDAPAWTQTAATLGA